MKTLHILSLGSILTISIGAFFLTKNNSKSLKNKHNASDFTASFIEPPHNDFDIDEVLYKINPKKDTTLIHHTGTSIQIKTGDIVDINGKIPTEDITLKYREFHNPLDGYLAGIPMNYDSAGTEYVFESGGMFEIDAVTQTGEKLFIQKDSLLEIELASENAVNTNLYILDTVKQQWIYRGKDKLEAALPMLDSNGKQISIKPELEDTSKFRFTIDLVKGEFPELEDLEGITFQILDSQKFSNALYSQVWDDIYLDYDNQREYVLGLFNENGQHHFKCKPVFGAKDYSKQSKKFLKKYKKYIEKTLKSYSGNYRNNYLNLANKIVANVLRKKRITEMQKQVLKTYSERINSGQMKISEYMPEDLLKELFTDSSLSSKIKREIQLTLNKKTFQRTLNINRFGYWNCDNPRPLPRKYIVKFINEDNQNIQSKSVHCAYLNRNMRISGKALRIDSTGEMIAWVEFSDSTMALIEHKELEFIRDKGVKTLQLKEESYADVIEKIKNKYNG